MNLPPGLYFYVAFTGSMSWWWWVYNIVVCFFLPFLPGRFPGGIDFKTRSPCLEFPRGGSRSLTINRFDLPITVDIHEVMLRRTSTSKESQSCPQRTEGERRQKGKKTERKATAKEKSREEAMYACAASSPAIVRAKRRFWEGETQERACSVASCAVLYL